MLQKIKMALMREAPTLITLAGISGFVLATVMVAKATSQANRDLAYLDHDMANDLTATDKDVFVGKTKVIFKNYHRPMGVMLISSGMVLGSNYLHKRRYAALSSLYLLTNEYYEVFKKRVIEEVGDKTFKKIENGASRPPKGNEPEEHLLNGDDVLVFDTFSARYFGVGSVEDIRTIVNDLNHIMYSQSWVDVNDFYYEVGLLPIEYGRQFGWAIEDGPLDIRFGSALVKDKVPCVTITFDSLPKHVYQRLYKNSI
jgi:hypothetical protein